MTAIVSYKHLQRLSPPSVVTGYKSWFDFFCITRPCGHDDNIQFQIFPIVHRHDNECDVSPPRLEITKYLRARNKYFGEQKRS